MSINLCSSHLFYRNFHMIKFHLFICSKRKLPSGERIITVYTNVFKKWGLVDSSVCIGCTTALNEERILCFPVTQLASKPQKVPFLQLTHRELPYGDHASSFILPPLLSGEVQCPVLAFGHQSQLWCCLWFPEDELNHN